MDYRRCCIEAGVNLLPLEDDSFDPKETDPEPFDDTTPLDLDELEADTLLTHPSDEESEEDEEEGARPTDPLANVGRAAPTLPSGQLPTLLRKHRLLPKGMRTCLSLRSPT